MAILNARLKGSTLMETLVATVLIVIIFMVSSMVLNNLLKGKVQGNVEKVRERIHLLEYAYVNGGLELPYVEDFENWEIRISQTEGAQIPVAVLFAENPKTGKTITQTITHAD
ncbi:MAG: hypothetical protein AAFX53_16120 [Bacteroidota bacterium]